MENIEKTTEISLIEKIKKLGILELIKKYSYYIIIFLIFCIVLIKCNNSSIIKKNLKKEKSLNAKLDSVILKNKKYFDSIIKINASLKDSSKIITIYREQIKELKIDKYFDKKLLLQKNTEVKK